MNREFRSSHSILLLRDNSQNSPDMRRSLEEQNA
jgi:hypothetical protein